MVIQERLEMLVSSVHYMYITNRTLDYNTADLDVLQSVSTWMDQLGDDPDEETIQAYRDNLHKRVWFESACLRLHCQVYGEDARALLLEKAQNKLDKLRFDNRSKKFTFGHLH